MAPEKSSAPANPRTNKRNETAASLYGPAGICVQEQRADLGRLLARCELVRGAADLVVYQRR